MWTSYLLIALRSLARQRLFSVINVAGLAAGMTACLLMAVWVGNELRYDRWVPQAEQVFVVQSRTQYPGRPLQTWRHAPGPMLPALAQDFAAQVKASTRYLIGTRTMRVGEQVANQQLVLADSGFFDVLPWPVREGSTQQALRQPNQLVVTPSFERKWFGPGKALGQTVTVTVKGEPRAFTVAAVLEPLPTSSMFDFEVVALLNPQDLPSAAPLQSWGAFSVLSLVRLNSADDAKLIEAGAQAFVGKHQAPFLELDKGFWYRPVLVPLTRTHLSPVDIAGPGRPPGDAALVAAVAAIGLLVLMIATITYVNLVTARLSLRAREVGLRKTLGATRGQLITQFLVESTVLAALAGLVALSLVELALPVFNALLGQQLPLHYLGEDGVLWPLLAMVLAVGLLGGWHPALVLSRLHPRQALVGDGSGGPGARLRQALVIGQFAIAVALIGCTLVIQAQLSHLRGADLGYRAEGMLAISGLNRTEVKPHQAALLQAMQRVPGVRAATRTLFDPTNSGISRQPVYLSGVPDTQAPQVSVQPSDWDYVATFGARLLAGRDLNRDAGGDDVDALDEKEIMQRGVNVLINRSALSFFGTTDPQAAVGRSFQLGQPPGRYTATVVGVIEDIRLRGPRDKPEPTLYARDTEHGVAMTLRFEGVPPAAMMQALEAVWRERFPQTPFSARLAVDAIDDSLQAERRTGQLLALFAGLAIVLCALGLYGLAVFTAQRRTREIGLRKLMGARVVDILRLLLWQFSRPVLVALLLASPVAAWVARDWLEQFDVRIALTPWPFVAAGTLALLIAWLTVASHAWKVARASPALALRHE